MRKNEQLITDHQANKINKNVTLPEDTTLIKIIQVYKAKAIENDTIILRLDNTKLYVAIGSVINFSANSVEYIQSPEFKKLVLSMDMDTIKFVTNESGTYKIIKYHT